MKLSSDHYDISKLSSRSVKMSKMRITKKDIDIALANANHFLESKGISLIFSHQYHYYTLEYVKNFGPREMRITLRTGLTKAEVYHTLWTISWTADQFKEEKA